MFSKKEFSLLIVILMGTISSLAQTTLKPGDTLTYQSIEQSKLEGGNLPAQAYRTQIPGKRTITITATGTDSSGGTEVQVTSHKEAPTGFNAMQMKVWEMNAGGKFKAMLSPEGALLIAPEDTLQAGDQLDTRGMSLPQARDMIVAQTKDPGYQGKVAANEIGTMFSVANAVVLSCGKRTSLSPGDTWRVMSKPDGNTYEVAVGEKQAYLGHDVVVLNAKGKSDRGGIGITVTTEATIYYDPHAHLLVGSHSASIQTFAQRGMTTTLTSELSLKQ